MQSILQATLQPCCNLDICASDGEIQRNSSLRSQQFQMYSSHKRPSRSAVYIPFIKQASNSSIQTNLTTNTPVEDPKLHVEKPLRESDEDRNLCSV